MRDRYQKTLAFLAEEGQSATYPRDFSLSLRFLLDSEAERSGKFEDVVEFRCNEVNSPGPKNDEDEPPSKSAPAKMPRRLSTTKASFIRSMGPAEGASLNRSGNIVDRQVRKVSDGTGVRTFVRKGLKEGVMTEVCQAESNDARKEEGERAGREEQRAKSGRTARAETRGDRDAKTQRCRSATRLTLRRRPGRLRGCRSTLLCRHPYPHL